MKVLYLQKGTFRKLAAVLLLAGISCVYSFGGGFRYLNVFLNDSSAIPVYSVETPEKQLAFTFDVSEGVDHTAKIVEVLEKKKVKATFFLVGGWIDKNPAMTKRLFAHGYELENHSDTHQHMTGLEKEKMNLEIAACSRKIEKTTNGAAKPAFFRLPFGEYNSAVLKEVGNEKLLCVQGDVNMLDINFMDNAKIVENIVSKAGNGSIVILSAGVEKTPQVLEEAITRLERDGYKFCTLSEMVLTKDFYVDHGGRQRRTE